MPKFPSTIYLNSSSQDDEVIIFGKSPEQESDDLNNGIARVGGDWRQPNYAKSYLRAARVLLKNALQNKDIDQLCMPIFYLQRHAIELLIKSLLGMLYEAAQMRFELYKDDKSKKSMPSKEAVKRLTTSHNLSTLNKDLHEISKALQIEGYPSQLAALIDTLQKIETNPTWSRYPSSGNVGESLHLKSEAAIPIVELNQQLELVFQEINYNMGQEPETFETAIYQEWNYLMNQLNNQDSHSL